ncbi:MAG: hypothetical protein KDN20_02605 [Verrucomicrobiae bacterium]|nr:hypothetical protein [Verrucomicrobiae bacterium]
MKTLTDKDINAEIRSAISSAIEEETEPFNLSGRGHEPRVTLCLRLAAIIRGVEIPCVYISGYGANCHYPERVFRRAAKTLKRKLGWEPIQFLSWESKAYRADRDS